jgi:putative ABC transport system permease protein
MIVNYLKIILRNVLKNKVYAAINILGLAIGMACSILIILWVQDEFAVDAFHSNNSRLYRVLENQYYSTGEIMTTQSTPAPMAPAIKEKFSEIELATRMTWEVPQLVSHAEQGFFEKGRFVDPDFLAMFSFPLQAGNAETALQEPNSIIISQALARKYFDGEDALGKSLVVNNKDHVVVTGILEAIPRTSSLEFDYLMPFDFYFEMNKSWLDQWGNNNIRTYIQLPEGTNATAFEETLRGEIKLRVENSNIDLHLQPFGEYYLYGEYKDGKNTGGGRIEFVRIFSLVALFVLLIACINFMNLSTAQSAKRGKEAGMRKVVGATRGQLVGQFLTESLIFSIGAFLVALGVVSLLLGPFGTMTDKTLSLNLLDARFIIVMAGTVLVTGLVAGSYPAIFISRYQPVRVLKGVLKSGKSAGRFRKILVVKQFALSITLIACTVVVYRQLHYMQTADIGFERENLVAFRMFGDMHQHLSTVKEELRGHSAIEGVAASSQFPLFIGNSTWGVEWEGKDPDERILFTNMGIDFGFVETMKMHLVEGRTFDEQIPGDTAHFLINEAAARVMGMEQASEQFLTLWGDRKGKILGVIKDFNFQSSHSKIEPLIFYIIPQYNSFLTVRVAEGRAAEGLTALEEQHKRYAPAYPFEYQFISDSWEKSYRSEQRISSLFAWFAGLSVFISCLGLFGLSAFAAEQRTKELGVRKVLGAEVHTLVHLLSREFLILVIISASLGCPLAWYFMSRWLQNYPFAVPLEFFTFAWPALFALVLALLTVSYHALRAAWVNPAHALRYE